MAPFDSSVERLYHQKELQDRETRTIAGGIALMLIAPLFAFFVILFTASVFVFYAVWITVSVLGVCAMIQGFADKLKRKQLEK